MGLIDYFHHKLNKLKNPIFIDYPVQPKVRWGFGKPMNPALEARISSNFSKCLEAIEGINFLEALRAIPAHLEKDKDTGLPYWHNEWISPVDGISIMAALHSKPNIYLEIGSGVSTRFARHAVQSFGLDTRVISIDPNPRIEIDGLCDEVIRLPLEDYDLSKFRSLQSGDVIFVDNSHRVFQNSDVTVFFMEILPILPKGVTVGLHDIYLPADYPLEWRDRYYSEQYLLAAWLLANKEGPEVLWPVFYSCVRADSREKIKNLLMLISGPLSIGEPTGGAFWFRTS